jgi:hypothetical protein
VIGGTKSSLPDLANASCLPTSPRIAASSRMARSRRQSGAGAEARPLRDGRTCSVFRTDAPPRLRASRVCAQAPSDSRAAHRRCPARDDTG